MPLQQSVAHPYSQPDYDNFITVFRKEVNCVIDMMYVLSTSLSSRGMGHMSTEKLYEAVSDLSYVVENRYEKEFNVEGKNTEKTLPLYWIPEEKKTIRSCMKTEIQSMLAEISEEIKESIRGVVQVSDVVTFPVSVFDALEWKEGDSLDFKLQDDKTILITRVENATIEINQGELDPTTGS